jgi:hypothetical protein
MDQEIGEIADFDFITVVYHDQCADGFFSAAQFYLLEQISSFQSNKEGGFEAEQFSLTQKYLKQIFRKELEICEKKLKDTNNETPNQVLEPKLDSNLENSTEEGKNIFTREVLKQDFETQIHYMGYVHGDIEKFSAFHKEVYNLEPKIGAKNTTVRNLLLVIDIASGELIAHLSPQYSHVIVIDHHQSMENKSFKKNPETGEIFSLPACNKNTYVFTTKCSASAIIYQAYFRKFYSKNCDKEMNEYLCDLLRMVNDSDTMSVLERGDRTRKIVGSFVWHAYQRSFEL